MQCPVFHLEPTLVFHHKIRRLQLFIGGDNGKIVMSLRNVQGDEPVGLLSDGPHVGLVIFGKEYKDLPGKAVEEEAGENGSGELLHRAVLQYLHQHG